MRAIPAFLILLLAVSPSRADDRGATHTKARLEIEGLLKRVAGAERSGDAATLAACYEGDGLLLPSSGEPVRGRDDITRRYQAIFAGKAPRLQMESEELWVMDDLAVSRGAAREAAAHKSLGPVRNRYVMTMKRHGDEWQVHSLVWNSGSRASAGAK